MHDTWSIPAKTFLVGEYAALKEQSAILLTTTPCFELRFTSQPGLHGIHPQSPAGRWWAHCDIQEYGFSWHDPYRGLGGLGASSAQFLSVYQACAQIRGQQVEQETLLQDYWHLAATHPGIRPSGYDLLAQRSQGCVYLNRHTDTYADYNWSFSDLGFILLHSKHKMATHEHLQQLVLNNITGQLSDLVEYAKSAFIDHSSYHLVEAVKAYHQILTEQGWVAEHSLRCIQRLYQDTDALAIKGCGAMGSDVLLLLVKQTQMTEHVTRLTQTGWHILATNEAIYSPQPVLTGT
ncbi:MAG: hypothetical protein KBB94_00850 [Legionellaceae bacterium]|nr:hypothetical protein [Legionellaceae bacterium]MBP9774296.1 hypothetical protein [Legionellaceae bacterium]